MLCVLNKKMKSIVYILLLTNLVFGSSLRASVLSIAIGSNITIPLQSKAYLFGDYVNQRRIIDSISSGNSIVFNLNNTLQKGMYNVMLYTDLKDLNGKYQRIGFDVIVTGEDIEFTVDITDTRNLGSVKAKSGDNYIYYQHFNQSKLLEQKSKVLEDALKQYPEADEFYIQLQKQSEKVKQTQIAFSQSNENYQSNSMVSYYLKIGKLAESKSIDKIDFSNPLLKNSPFIPVLVWNYLDDTENDQSITGSNSDKLITRLDNLLPKLQVDDEVYNLMLAEIIKYYEKKGLNDVVVHLNKRLLPDVCENPELTKRIKEKNKILEKILVGNTAPEIEFANSGAIQKLNDVKAEFTLLLFWESTCYHCQELIKELTDFYKQNKTKGFEIVAISMDTSKIAYTNFISENSINWLNYSEFKGWESQAAKNYNILATPSMFLLDKEKKIIAKPVSINELKALVL